ncbi:hypothetical protein Cadr_000025796 [Camelus dromedarius]|uniref:Uncharacterized protein n=1 Tax=Camelus dromedarius TaxID=9838 RepID=A0A5N4CM68_CAMDR|nr:hypothetical protein Cadr_000025796 [Camelus dromedarius]
MIKLNQTDATASRRPAQGRAVHPHLLGVLAAHEKAMGQPQPDLRRAGGPASISFSVPLQGPLNIQSTNTCSEHLCVSGAGLDLGYSGIRDLAQPSWTDT